MIVLQNIKASVDNTEDCAIEIARQKLKRAGIAYEKLYVSKKSIDARKKNDICYVCSVTAKTETDPDEDLLKKLGAIKVNEREIEVTPGSEAMSAPPLVVGFGPCGMFCALMLAEQGYNPIVIERGKGVEERRLCVDNFYKNALLNIECNIQFGAGGAGTFSDGKLVTRINDDKCSYVLRRFVEFGAPEDILVNAKPHIGTDLLVETVKGIASRIEQLGGKIYYDTKLLTLEKRGAVTVAGTTHGEIECGAVVLAIGHSARDTYSYLLQSGYDMRPKAFSVGVRIEHIQEKLNFSMYGKMASKLPPAEYSLSRIVGDRGVYSFCMCPGGEVVAAASEQGGVVTNGMSRHARNGKNANAALAVSVLPKDFGNTVEGAMFFQRSLERRAFEMGGSNYNAPVSTVGDFLNDKKGTPLTAVSSTYMGGDKYELCDMNRLLPKFIAQMLKEGICDFDRKISGFASPDAVLTGVETRTSSPVRIERGDNLCATGTDNIYPCGEGAGYAGGITSAAVDGIRVALKLIGRYKPDKA